MLAFTIYLLKVIVCSGILFGYYWLMLRNKIFHQYNRFYLLTAVLLSLVLPLVEIDVWLLDNEPAPQAIQLIQAVSSNGYLDEIIVNRDESKVSAEQFGLLFYCITTGVFLVLFLAALARVWHLFRKHQHSVVDNIIFVNTTARGTPFSFLRYIFWNDHIDPESALGQKVFLHELAHVQQKHSYDKLFLNAVMVFGWINPFFWLVRKELYMIHEFIADKIAVEDSDTEAFAAMILQAAYPQHRFQLTNPFFYSPIKRRLMMITKNKNSRVGYIGRVLALPLTLLVFAAFTLKAKTFNGFYAGDPITVVIDAGHGGSDLGAVNPNNKILEKDVTLAISKLIQSANTNKNIRILLSRNTDELQTPQQRVAFTKAKKADLFISIHLDSEPEGEAGVKSGVQVMLHQQEGPHLKSSQLLATALINQFSQGFKLPVTPQPQMLQRSVKVLKDAECAAILLEAGYLSNSADIAYLQTKAAQKAVATNVLAAIESWAVNRDQVAALLKSLNAPSQPGARHAVSSEQDTIPKVKLEYKGVLKIVDGNVTSQEAFEKIDPKTIERVEVLKDKSATALYGEKGKNGVIIVTTKTAGKVSGVTITRKDTSVNEASGSLTVRGFKSGSNQPPLYVVDGDVKDANFDINIISPEYIESINILKDQSAIVKYGERAKNGVIEINTKSKAPGEAGGKTESKLKGTPREITVVGYGNGNKAIPEEPEVVLVGYEGSAAVIEKYDDKVFTKTETSPRFPGGADAWKKYLVKQLDANMPYKEGWKAGTYRITVTFMVKKDGSIVDIKTSDYPGSLTSEHCIELIKKGPKWEPALQNGQKVNAYRKQVITFVVEQKPTT